MPRTRAVENQHLINLAALLVSAAAAILAPLQTFLIAYAVIGPFHYLTEIAWLRKKQFYFASGIVPSGVFLVVATLLCGAACLDFHFRRGFTAYTVAGLIVLSLGALVRNWIVLAGSLGLLFAIKFFVHGYGLFMAAFVPTVAHVYFFTLLFLLSGILRSKRAPVLGWCNAALLLVLPIALVFLSPVLSARLGASLPGHYWMTSESMFAPIHEYLAGLLGIGMHFNPAHALEPHALAVFRVLAFIYLHHYLNWFAKTELLEWHRVSRRSWALILALYAAALGSYAWSFALGFYAAYFLSLLHVLLELPLNWHAGTSLATGIWSKLRVRRLLAATG